MEEKNFNEWMKLKQGIHSSKRMPAISEGDVWWCGIGENVGVEINGKSKFFSRPVLVLKKFSRYSFLGVPLTSQQHVGSWYVPFKFQGKKQIAVLAQIRILSVARLYNRLGVVSNSDLDLVREGFRRLYSWE